MGHADAAGRASPRGCQPHQALLSYNNRPTLLSQPTVLSWGQKTPPAKFHSCKFPTSGNLFSSPLSLLMAPSSVLEWSPRCHAIGEEWRELCCQRGGRSPLPVSKALPSQAISGLRGQPCCCRFVEEVSGVGNFLGSESGCQMTAPSRHPSVLGLSSILYPREKAYTGQGGCEELERLCPQSFIAG